MSRYNYSEIEQQINQVLTHQNRQLSLIPKLDLSEAEEQISKSEQMLLSMGYSLPQQASESENNKKPIMVVPEWESLCLEAERNVGKDVSVENLFSEEELSINSKVIQQLSEEYRALYKLDRYDVAIGVLAALAGALADILLVGIPKKTLNGISAGRLSDYIRKRFETRFPEKEMQKLAGMSISKVPYDAQDNRNTSQYVNGLSAYYHRLLSLGHDPILGLFVGVFDIMSGRMTTIGKNGKVVSQIMENYADRTESNLFNAIGKQLIHFKSDVTTSMGLPVPLMGLFNLLQIGSIGKEEQTIAEIVQGMYYEGYDFIHFCSMSMSAIITEVIVRLGYAFKRISEGYSVEESIPISTRKCKHPKMETMLLIGHAGAVAANTGKIFFTQSPLAINYPQWVAFAKYVLIKTRDNLITKGIMRNQYVEEKLDIEYRKSIADVGRLFSDVSKDYIVVME